MTGTHAAEACGGRTHRDAAGIWAGQSVEIHGGTLRPTAPVAESVTMSLQLKDRYHIGERVSDDPIIQVIDGFVSDNERNHIMTLASPHLQQALVSTAGASKQSANRTGSVAWVRHDATPVVHGLVKRVSQLVGIPVKHAESLQVVHYADTEEYRPHFDAYDITTEKGRARTAKGGQRLVTALMYLNEVEDGGSTVFPNAGVEVDPLPGRMVIFHNIADLTATDMTRNRRSLHGASPVWGGEKWACNLWFRQHAYQTAGPEPDTVVGATASKPGPPPPANSTAAAAAARRKQQRAARAKKQRR